MKNIYLLVGARPNFIKISKFKELSIEFDFNTIIIHSGQHYDFKMSDIFFQQLGVFPDKFLNTSTIDPAYSIGDTMLKLSDFFRKNTPDLLIVPGDVNTTLAGSIVANKLGIPLAHLESGLRSFDLSMPEENNRIITDCLSDYLFVTEDSGIRNLETERVKGNKFLVGNTMIDSLVKYTSLIDKISIVRELNLQEQNYFLITFHRPGNVDEFESLEIIVNLIISISKLKKVIFPLHPRTLSKLKFFNLLNTLNNESNVVLTEPLGYFEFQNFVKNSLGVITDSGGIQEETTYLNIPCLTVRPNTERPITVEIGTNTLVDLDLNKILLLVDLILSKKYKTGKIPHLWDGLATHRILNEINKII